MGKGAFDGTDVLYTGMIGMHGTKTSNLGVAECDLLIVVGRVSVTVLWAIRTILQPMQRFYT